MMETSFARLGCLESYCVGQNLFGWIDKIWAGLG